jgi:hypothetical protein
VLGFTPTLGQSRVATEGASSYVHFNLFNSKYLEGHSDILLASFDENLNSTPIMFEGQVGGEPILAWYH